jgi:hypothetical protein
LVVDTASKFVVVPWVHAFFLLEKSILQNRRNSIVDFYEDRIYFFSDSVESGQKMECGINGLGPTGDRVIA